MIDLQCNIIISQDILTQYIADETVLLDLKTEKYFSLDEVGTHIWQLLQEQKKLQKILSNMLKEYDVEEKQLQDDLLAFLEQLLEAGLITLESEKAHE